LYLLGPKNLSFFKMKLNLNYSIYSIWLMFFLSFLPKCVFSQETNSNVSGIVKSDKKELLAGASIIVTHQPTKNTYTASSRNDGKFYFSNLKPGGPYSITITYSGYETLTKENLFLDFSSSANFYDAANNNAVEFILTEKATLLKEVIAKNNLEIKNTPGIESSINNRQLLLLPSISRNLQDYVRLVPQAKVNGDGLISLAGQNNKFNAFFIDGSNNNDILGNSLSGINGGQTNTPPISIEVLDKINVLQAPYDVQYSNFTGGSINAITKSGSNEVKSSIWYYFRNQNMAGQSPKLSPFLNQTYGLWLSGPFIKNKLFYFISAESQLENRPQPFNFADYNGKSRSQDLKTLAETLRNKYNYDPGSFSETKEKLNALRTLLKVDWNPSEKNKITILYRYNIANRVSPRPTGSTLIAFQNNAAKTLFRTHTASLEWKSFFKKDISNRLLITYNNQKFDLQWLGQPFPQVAISDGSGAIFLGSIPASQLSLFKAYELTALDILRFVLNKNRLSIGSEFDFTKINDLIVFSYFGDYRYRSLADFLAGQYAFRYFRSFPLNEAPKDDHTNAGAKYSTLRLGLFINDEINLNENFSLNAGIRIDGNALPKNYTEDTFFNDTAAKIISEYYNLDGARSGKTNKTAWFVAPRLGFTYKIQNAKITIRGGAGLFSGRILNMWASDTYNNSLGTISINPLLFGMRFNPDPYHQPNYDSLGILPGLSKGAPTIMAKNFKYPSVFRSSLSVEKKLNHGWTLTSEFLFTKSINEWKVLNVNLLPPQKMTQSPDERLVYSLNTGTENIPLLPGGSNPYSAIYLLSNNHSKKGFSYSATALIDKSFKNNFSITTAYTYENSRALFEPYYNASPAEDQWNQSETVNGKNLTTRSKSDLDLGHRVYASIFKKFNYLKNKTSTSVSIFYNGQSGQPFSYVYNGSIINDNGISSNYDLVYIPTSKDLELMTFIPFNDNTVSYSAQQQKDMLNNYILHDRYLKKHRGQFAERNGARLPFTNIIDVRIQQDFNIRINKKKSVISVTYDIFNFTNMLNKNWGRIYFLPGDNFPLIQFAGYSSISPLVPQYQFIPFSGTPYSVQTSTAPGNSARWLSQLGFKINFN
jgi:Outer membrane receptor for ferrienterochelin and colicins